MAPQHESTVFFNHFAPCRFRYDPNKGRPHEAILPVPEASDVDRCSSLDFAQQREEVARIKGELEAIGKDRDTVLEDKDGPVRIWIVVLLISLVC